RRLLAGFREPVAENGNDTPRRHRSVGRPSEDCNDTSYVEHRRLLLRLKPAGDLLISGDIRLRAFGVHSQCDLRARSSAVGPGALPAAIKERLKTEGCVAIGEADGDLAGSQRSAAIIPHDRAQRYGPAGGNLKGIRESGEGRMEF